MNYVPEKATENHLTIANIQKEIMLYQKWNFDVIIN